MEQILLNRDEAAYILGFSTTTLDRRVREGKIPKVKGHKTPKFNLYDIMKIAGTEVDRLSAFERKRLEREIEGLKKEIEVLTEENNRIKQHIRNVVADMAPILKEA